MSTFIKVNDTQIMKGAKEARKEESWCFSWDQLAGSPHVHHSNTIQRGKRGVSRELYIKYCSGIHCHTWVTCSLHEWTLTNGKWLPRRRKKASCCWEIKLFICIISFIVYLSNVLNHIYILLTFNQWCCFSFLILPDVGQKWLNNLFPLLNMW